MHYGPFRKNASPHENSKNILGVNENNIAEAKKSLRNLGYWVAPHTINQSLLKDFEKNAIRRLATLKNIDLQNHDLSSPILYPFNDEMVFLGSDWVMAQELSIKLATSDDVNQIVGDYLGVNPILNLPESWFSFPVNKVNENSPQNWHWDCDRVKWIKAFIYINDVTQNNGPHAYVAGSHRGWRVRSETSRVTRDVLMNEYEYSDEIITNVRIVEVKKILQLIIFNLNQEVDIIVGQI